MARERHAQAELERTLAESRPDVISIWHMAALPTSLLAPLVDSGIPLVFVVCDDWLIYAPAIDPWMSYFVKRPRLGRLIERLTGVPAHVPELGSAGAFCFVSDQVRRRAARQTNAEFPMATVTYSGVDTRDFPTPSESDRPWRWRLLQADRLDPRKGLETSVRALAHLPAEAQLQFLGRGDPHYRAHLEAVAGELNLADRLSFGAVPAPRWARSTPTPTFFCFPSSGMNRSGSLRWRRWPVARP